jgi:WD40 repeat protein
MKRSKPGSKGGESNTTSNANNNKYGRFLCHDHAAGSSSIVLLVTTSRPPAVTTSSMGGTLNLIDLESGTVQASTRIQGGDLQHSKQQLGLQSIALFPPPPCPVLARSCPTMGLGYGMNNDSDKKNDTFAVLLTIRNKDNELLTATASSTTTSAAAAPPQNPVAHWRCRLPEPMSAGLTVSPVTSRHVIGAGASGNLYVWDVWNQGRIIRTASVHYRSISCMIWSTPIIDMEQQTIVASPWDCHLITAGIDGMVHVFTHVDLVEETSDQESAPTERLAPVRTWSKHQLAVRALVALEGGRFVSSGDDGLVLLMDIASEAVLLSIQLPDGIRALAHDEGCLLAGSIKGTIHRIDLDEYAAERAREKGANLPSFKGQSSASRDFGKLTELTGHNRPISALAILGEDAFVSGDESGVLRVWKQCKCARVIRPWNVGGSAEASATATTAASSSAFGKKPTAPPLRPVTAIHVLYNNKGEATEGSLSFLNSRSTKGTASWPSIASPLQKYPTNDGSQFKIPIPYLKRPKFDPPQAVDYEDEVPCR